jgi:sugar/nucleoside kinase (ribokinase family)
MIVVVGRPAILARSAPGPGDDASARPAGLVASIAVAAAAAGARVELVGTIGDDDDGDALTVGLSRSGVGHAALLRDPAGRTPRVQEPETPMPRLEAADIELGLRYHSEYRVLVLAEPLPEDAERAALDAASFQGAAVVAVVSHDREASDRLGAAGTVLQAPADSDRVFTDLVGRYAAALDAGQDAAVAFNAARAATGWQPEGST